MFLFSWYNRMMTRRPILTQSISAGFLFGTGDAIAQLAIEKQQEYNIVRGSRLFLYGTCIAGPVIVYWYRFLGHKIKLKHPMMQLITRVGMDQLLFAPIATAFFFTANGILEGRNFSEITQKLEKGYKEAMISNYKVWPAVQLLNFYMIPLHYQSIFVNTIALGWNSYMSALNHRISSSITSSSPSTSS